MKRLFGVFVILNIITCPQNAMCDIMAELDALMKNNPVKEYCVGGNGKVQTIEKNGKTTCTLNCSDGQKETVGREEINKALDEYCKTILANNTQTYDSSTTKEASVENAPKADAGECTNKDPNAKKVENKEGKCIITQCNDGFVPSKDGQKCEAASGQCSAEQLANIEHASAGELKKGECVPTECEAGFKVEKNKCVNQDSKKKNKEKSDTKSGGKDDDKSDDKSKNKSEDPKLSEEDSKKKIEELKANAKAMKDKEQSTENKMLGAASMAATGLGAMQAMSAYSEKQADEEAEQAMKAYLATFHCNYGDGKNVQGGEKDVQLPGGNELVDLYAEYVNLANNLKVRKAALDMRPGIESESILDSATSGLYDDVAIGKTSGAFTSLARALMDPNGPDAIAWAKQKADSQSQFKTGLTAAGLGAVGGALGNMLINKNAPKENSDGIVDKYKDVLKSDNKDVKEQSTENKTEDVVKDGVKKDEVRAGTGDVVADAQQAVVTVPAITDMNTEGQVVVDVPAKTDGADNIVMEKDGVHIKRIENITNAQSALDALSQQFNKTPSDNLKQAWNKFAEQCQGYQGVLSLELDVLRGNEYDMYEVLCYFPDLDQTADTVKAAYAVNSEYFTTDNISRSIKIGQSPKFQETDYMKKYETFNQRQHDMGATYNIANINCQIPGVDLQNECNHYSAMIRIHDKDGKMYLEMLKWDEKNDNSSTFRVE